MEGIVGKVDVVHSSMAEQPNDFVVVNFLTRYVCYWHIFSILIKPSAQILESTDLCSLVYHTKERKHQARQGNKQGVFSLTNYSVRVPEPAETRNGYTKPHPARNMPPSTLTHCPP